MSDQHEERRDRYAAAIRAESSRVDDIALAEAVMAVADAEQVEYEETVVGNLNEINTRLQAENAQLLAQVEEARQARLRAENDARTAKREAAAPSAPTDRDLCDRIAEALYRQDWPLKQVWMQALAGDRTRYEALADAVLAVLPARADRAAVFHEAADDLSAAFGDPMVKHVGALGAGHLRRRAREIEAQQAEARRPFDAQAGLRRLAGDLACDEDAASSAPADQDPDGDMSAPCDCGKGAVRYRAADCPDEPRRMADETQQVEPGCTCADAGPEFAPTGHYADCPQADEAEQAGEDGFSAALRDRLRRAFCEASGFEWDPDSWEPDEYGEQADAVLAVLPAPATTDVREIVNCLIAHAQGFQDVLDESDRDPWARLVRADIDALRTAIAALPEPADDAGTVGYWQAKLAAVTDGRDSLQRETARLHRELASAERIRENADFHLGQEMARRQRAEKEMRRMADEAQQTTASGVDLPTLAAALDGLHTLIATSSRDWGTYRVDAWIWAVLCGWDCEEAEHDDTCTHGAMEEMAAQHGWSTDAVAKAHRYRAAVRHLTDGAQTEADRIVARRSPATSSVYCTTHGTPEMAPLTSDDLPDGAHCQICGTDVLISQVGESRG